VRFEVQGLRDRLEALIDEIGRSLPPRAVLSRLSVRYIEPAVDEIELTIVASRNATSAPASAIPPDIGVCETCEAELFAATDRRFRYPFITCTDCGPRYTIARQVPWDRRNTSMDVYPLCTGCEAEYNDPAGRRYRAETISCHDCGPMLLFRHA